MKKGIVRFASLYVFNVAVLLLIGLLLPTVRVGLHALWAGVILTLAALFIKPTLTRLFRRSAAKSAGRRSKLAEKAVQYALVYAVELIIWVLTVWFSAVSVRGYLWGYLLPPLLLLVGWVVYDLVDDVLRRKTGEVYDSVHARLRGGSDASNRGESAPDSPATRAGRDELNDGLTPEQRRMLDDLG